MKREREKRYYFIYGNLTERFSNWFESQNRSDLSYLLDHPEYVDEFSTSYQAIEDEYALKQKHYTQLLHTVALDFYPEDEVPESMFERNIYTTKDTDGCITLTFRINAKQKDEAILIGTTVTESGSEGNDVASGPEQGL